jgi:hypothetical protein
MRDIARAEGELAGTEPDAVVADYHLEFALDHVEPLVFLVVDMPGRTLAGRQFQFDGVKAASVAAVSEDTRGEGKKSPWQV